MNHFSNHSYDFNGEEQFHIKVKKEDIGKYVILPGDPGRVEPIAKFLENPAYVGSFREFTIWNGYLEGELVTVCSSGIGGPSASLAVEELSNLGAEYFIRVGTCGAISMDVLGGDVIIPTGAIRFEGTTRQYVPLEYPAVPDYEVVGYLVRAAKNLNRKSHTGVIQSKDSFYAQHDPDSKPVAAMLNQYWEAWKGMGVLGSEMECSTLFVVGQYKRVKTGAVVLVNANQERRKAGLDDPKCFDNNISIEVAVEAYKLMIKDKKNH